MKCNVCGGEIPHGDKVCKFCGNIISQNEKKEEEKNIERPRYNHNDIDVPVDSEIYHTPPQRRTNYCHKCGRPLDGVTKKCVVCDARDVGQSRYRETENAQMAKKRKTKKKKNTARNIILSIVGLIILFTLTLLFTVGPLADHLGIGFKVQEAQTPPPSVEYTQKPKNTWEPERDKNTPKPTEEPTKEPVRTPTPHEEGDPVENRGGEYLYPSHTHLITEAELKEMSRDKIRKIYWEIYARHGLTFEGELADYFEMNHSWYLPTTMSEDEAKRDFNDIEKRNEKTIFDYQKKQGWR